VLIDGDNAQAPLVGNLLRVADGLGLVTVRRVYGDFTSPRFRSWNEVLGKHGIRPIQQFSYAKGKNATDHALIIDAMDLLVAGGLDGFCLVSSDSDFAILAMRLRDAGQLVYGFGKATTPKAFREACHKFILTDNLTGRNVDFSRAVPGGPVPFSRRAPAAPVPTPAAPVAQVRTPAPAPAPAVKAPAAQVPSPAAAVTQVRTPAPAPAVKAPAARVPTPSAVRKQRPQFLPVKIMMEVLAKMAGEMVDDYGWVYTGVYEARLKKAVDGFDFADYGYEGFNELLEANGRLFETRRFETMMFGEVACVRPAKDTPWAAVIRDWPLREAAGPSSSPAAPPVEFLREVLEGLSAADSEDGYVFVGEYYFKLRRARPGFSLADHGFETITELIGALPDLFQTCRRETSHGPATFVRPAGRALPAGGRDGFGKGRGRKRGWLAIKQDPDDLPLGLLMDTLEDLRGTSADGWVAMAWYGRRLREVKPDFNSGDYGYGSLIKLVAANDDLFELGAPRAPHHVHLLRPAAALTPDGVPRTRGLPVPFLRNVLRDLSRTGPGGWVHVDEYADRLKSEWNGFDPARYGHGSLSELARANGRLFQADLRPVKNAGLALYLRPAADEPRPAELPVEFLRETLAALSRGRADGWVHVGEYAAWLKRDRRGFDAADYGHPTVAELVLANGHLFLTAWRDLKNPVPVLFVRPAEDAPTTGGADG
jgi:hypothetical protein